MQMFLTPEEKIIEQLRTENAALKEQMAHIKEIEFPTKCIAIADIWKNKVTLLDETITQQAEAIRLKDDLIESQAASIEHYKSGLTSAIQDIEKYRDLCDQMAYAMEIHGSPLLHHELRYNEALEAWRA